MSGNVQIENGRIVRTSLGYEDHGMFTLYLHLEFGIGGCAYGGYALDSYDKDKKQRLGTAYGHQSIIAILQTLELERWEQLPGTFVRVEHEGLGGGVRRIGHLLKDRWLDFSQIGKEAR